MKVIHVVRKPLEGTVAQNSLKHGTGTLNIDRSRVHRDADDIAGWASTGTVGTQAAKGYLGTSTFRIRERTPEDVQEVLSKGRWPANLILEHKPGCQKVGTKRFAGTSGSASKPGVAVRRSGVHSEAGGHQTVGREQPRTGHADPDGKETVDAWECVPGCPVAALDEQSGVLTTNPGTYRKNERERTCATTSFAMNSRQGRVASMGDTGGASRFFRQFQRKGVDE